MLADNNGELAHAGKHLIIHFAVYYSVGGLEMSWTSFFNVA